MAARKAKKVVKKSPAKKKPVAKKKVAAKPAKAAKFKAPAAAKTAYKKTQIIEFLAGSTELSKKEVSSVLDALGELMHIHLKKRGGCGEFALPGMLKVVRKMKPATKARKGINPFTGEPTVFKAKPARVQLKIKALKKLKEMAE